MCVCVCVRSVALTITLQPPRARFFLVQKPPTHEPPSTRASGSTLCTRAQHVQEFHDVLLFHGNHLVILQASIRFFSRLKVKKMKETVSSCQHHRRRTGNKQVQSLSHGLSCSIQGKIFGICSIFLFHLNKGQFSFGVVSQLHCASTKHHW